MALSVLVMVGSGWRIYNASPIFPFTFPEWATLGGDVEAALARHNDPGVASAIAWHFAGMWTLVLSWLGFVIWGVMSGHFRRDFLPVSPRGFWRDFTAALRFRLDHRLGEYNAVQKVFYWGALLAVPRPDRLRSGNLETGPNLSSGGDPRRLPGCPHRALPDDDRDLLVPGGSRRPGSPRATHAPRHVLGHASVPRKHEAKR